MGKPERELAEKAERIITKLINGEQLSKDEMTHPFFVILEEFSIEIRRKYPEIISAYHIGNTYENRGDIKLMLPAKVEKYLELKFVDSGKGTLANISQDALTNLGIFDVISWSDFRERNNHRKTIIELMNRISFLGKPLKITDPDASIYARADQFKQFISSGTRSAEQYCAEILSSSRSSTQQKAVASVILDIVTFDKKVRYDYIKLLSNSSFNEEKLKKFVFLLLNGYHTQTDLSENMEKTVAQLTVGDNGYEVYYLYKDSQGIQSENLRSTLDIFKKKLKFDFDQNEKTSIVVSSGLGSSKINYIRIAFHWKNKFAGIQTPCLNIFKAE